MRTDNIGIVRVHLGEVPSNLHERVHLDDVQPELHAAVLADEIIGLEQSRAESEAQRIRLEALVVKQGNAITRYSTLLDSGVASVGKPDADIVQEAPSDALKVVTMNLAQRDTEVEKLSNILDRTFQAIDARDQQVFEEKGQLTRTADKAINLLERAVREGELSAEQLHMLNERVSSTSNASVRLENELDERNSVINNQNTLMERLVGLAEQSVSGVSARKRRKRSFWQRLFGGGKGI